MVRDRRPHPTPDARLAARGWSGTSTSLSQRLPVSRQAVAKHMAVLVRAGLVQRQTAGRERRYRIDEEQFARALAQFNAVSSAWDGRL